MISSLERALWARPLALVLGGAAAWLVSPGTRGSAMLAWLVGAFVLPTAAIALIARSPRLEGFARLAGPLVTLIGWATLAIFSGGLRSPFVVVMILEIVVAAATAGPRGVVWITGGVLAALGLIGALFGLREPGLLALECALVVAIGWVAGAMARRREAAERSLRAQREELGQRLDDLQRELADERVVSRVGENVARLAHGLKNAVHSLRGFVGLIEPHLEQGAGAKASMAGLRAAIDDLERLARMTLDGSADPPAQNAPGSPPSRPATGNGTGRPASRTRLAEAVRGARAEVETASPEVEWTSTAGAGGDAVCVAIEPAPLQELLVILMRNAVEAMKGSGRARVEYGENGGFGVVAVSDEGPGFGPEDLEQIFQPGYTTKQQGSGFGLFLARRIAEDHGGALALEAAEGGGARVRVELPAIAPPASPETGAG